jgi:hypothetical protein
MNGAEARVKPPSPRTPHPVQTGGVHVTLWVSQAVSGLADPQGQVRRSPVDLKLAHQGQGGPLQP